MGSKDGLLVIEVDGKQLKLEGDSFYCSSFEFSNKCYDISRGRIHFFSEQLEKVNLTENGVSYLGGKIVVKYSNQTIFSGFVSGTKSSNEGYSTSVEFFLSSPEFWLLSGRTVVSWNVSGDYSQILNKILSNYNSKFSGYNVDLPYTLPNSLIRMHDKHENDYDYVKRVSRMNGAFFYSLDGKVKIAPIKYDPSNSFKLKYDGKIGKNFFVKKIKFSTDITGIPKNISNAYIKEDKYQNISSPLVSASDKIGDGNFADGVCANIDDSISLNFVNPNIDSDETSKNLSKIEYKLRSINLSKCEITCSFWPELKVGGKMTLSGFSKTVDNSYIITSLTHKYENSEGISNFSTTISLNSDSICGASSFSSLGSIGKLRSFF